MASLMVSEIGPGHGMGEQEAAPAVAPEDRPGGSVSNGSGPSLRVRDRYQTESLPHWRSRTSINPNCPLGYGSVVNSQPV